MSSSATTVHACAHRWQTMKGGMSFLTSTYLGVLTGGLIIVHIYHLARLQYLQQTHSKQFCVLSRTDFLDCCHATKNTGQVE